MKAITLHQPYASLIALGLKKFETRNWPTNYRGRLAIHAGKRRVDNTGAVLLDKALRLVALPPEKRPFPEQLPLGCIVAIADLTECLKMVDIDADDPLTCPTQDFIYIQAKIGPLERSVGGWQSGRYAWKLENVVALPEPIPARGRQGLWNWEATV